MAIHGGCIGGAVDMVTAARIHLYATQDAFFLHPGDQHRHGGRCGHLQRLPKLIPLGVVKELAYTGAALAPPRRRAMAWSTRCLTPRAMVAAALQCAQEIASKPPIAIWGAKQAIHYARDHSVEDSLRQMGWLQGAIWSNQHVRESVTAMKQKRAGSFQNSRRCSGSAIAQANPSN